MADWNHIKRYTKIMNGHECNFRSTFEYHWAEYTQLRMDNGLIENWWYEDEDSWCEIVIGEGFHAKNKIYRPDFTIQYAGGHVEFEETKGYFPSKDYTKMRAYADQYDTPLTLIFNKPPYGAQRRRADRLARHINKVIWEAGKDIFKPIKHLFDV
jgi:predicted nuclease of restriction endonuclease-like RecB superfamily